MSAPGHPLESPLEHNLPNPEPFMTAMVTMCEDGGMRPQQAEAVLAHLALQAVEGCLNRVHWEMQQNNKGVTDAEQYVFDTVRTNARVFWAVRS